MKRFTVAGIFAMIGGAATLLLVASILYSCRQGGQPHDMGTDAHSGGSSHASVVENEVPSVAAHRDRDATKLTVSHS
jgi:hypothetical protein